MNKNTNMQVHHIHADIPAVLPVELVHVLAAGNGTRIERIVSKGHCSPPDFWYDQPENEWVLLLQGQALLRFEQPDRTLQLETGNYVNILAHEKHRVEWTTSDTETIWLAVFY